MAAPALNLDTAPDNAGLAGMSLDDVLKASSADIATARKDVAERKGQATSEYEEAKGRLKKADTAIEAWEPPPLIPIPPRPERQQTDPWQAFGSPAMALAVLGSRLTQTPLTAALNAGAGVMKAYKQNDMAEAQYQLEVWKANVDNAISLQEHQDKIYRMALDKMTSNRSEAIAMLKTAAAAYNDAPVKDLAVAGNEIDIAKLLDDRQKRTDAIKNRLPFIQVFDNSMDDFAKKNGGKYPPIPVQIQMARDAMSASPKSMAQSAKEEAKTGELSAIEKQIESIQQLLVKDQTVAGGWGALQEAWNRTGGQVLPGFQDRREFEAKMKQLQTMVQSKYLNSRYFSRSALERMEQLAPGLDAWEGPQDAMTALEEMKKVISGQINSGLPADTESSDFSGMSDEDLLRALGQ